MTAAGRVHRPSGAWSGQVYGVPSVAVDGEGRVQYRGKDRDRDVSLISVSLNAGPAAR